MSVPKFVWIIRSWCSLDSFWEHVREHKEFDVAYVAPELLLEEIDRIVLKEQSDWEDLCIASGVKDDSREFAIEKPTLDQLKSRPFVRFLTISSSTDDFMQSWYIERLKVADRD
jgi:hypothetical protein